MRSNFGRRRRGCGGEFGSGPDHRGGDEVGMTDSCHVKGGGWGGGDFETGGKRSERRCRGRQRGEMNQRRPGVMKTRVVAIEGKDMIDMMGWGILTCQIII